MVTRHPRRFRVVGLSAAGQHVEQLADQVRLLKPARVAVPTEEAGQALRLMLADQQTKIPTILTGQDASTKLARAGADVVLNAITGFAGLEPTLATLAAGSVLALANKESLVVGGPLVKKAAKPGQIVPVDSEHSAIAQSLRSGRAKEVNRLILTASGGPFRGRTRDQLRGVTVEQALHHPTWQMGRVVTINSSTLVNKGLELIEAALLFDVPWDRIQVVVHPQSMVHSMVEFRDGSTIAQCSPPDMRLPIALGLSWPRRLGNVAQACDWSTPSAWTFEPLDNDTFPAVELARRVGQFGGTAPATFNAANEECVDAFCEGAILFTDIVDIVTEVVEQAMAAPDEQPTDQKHQQNKKQKLTVEQIRTADAWARRTAQEAIGRRA